MGEHGRQLIVKRSILGFTKLFDLLRKRFYDKIFDFGRICGHYSDYTLLAPIGVRFHYVCFVRTEYGCESVCAVVRRTGQTETGDVSLDVVFGSEGHIFGYKKVI